MEDVLQLTRNLVLAKEDSNDSTEGDQNCNELLARMLDLGQTCQKEEDEEKRQELHLTWLTALELINDRVANLSALDQLHVVQALEALLLSDEFGSQQQRMDMIQTTGWDLIRLLAPYVAGSAGSEAMSLQIRATALRILEAVVNFANARELYLMILQTMNSISWDVDIEDLDSAVEGTVLFAVLNKMLSTVIARIKTKQLVRFMVSPIKAQIPVLELIEQLLQNRYGNTKVDSSKTDTSSTGKSWDEVLKVLIDAILDFADFCAGTISANGKVTFINAELETETQKRHYIIFYHVLNVFNHMVSQMPTNFSRTYYMQRHKKYDLKTIRPGSEQDAGADNEETSFSSVLKRSMAIASKAGLTMKVIAEGIRLADEYTQNDDGSESEEDDDTVRVSLFPWPADGAIAILATVIAFSDNQKMCNQIDFSSVFSNENAVTDVLDDFGVYLVNSLNQNRGSSSFRIDKCLVILHDLLERQAGQKLTLEDINRTFGGYSRWKKVIIPQEECTWIGLFQTVAYLASTSPDSTYRFLCHQFLAKLVEICTDEASVYLLIEVLKSCPFESLRAAAIGFTKQQIDNSLRKFQQDKEYCSIYISPLVVAEFFPVIFKYDGKKMMASESQFWDSFSTAMQAINFYYFLLISDEKNKLIGVRSKENVAFVRQNFIVNVQHTLDYYMKLYEEKKKELSGKRSQDTENKPHVHATSCQPVVSVGLNEEGDLNFSASEELELLHSRMMNLSILQDVLTRVDIVLEGDSNSK